MFGQNQLRSALIVIAAVGGIGLFAARPAAAAIVVNSSLTGIQQTLNNPCVIGDPSCNNGSFIYNSQSGQPGGVGGTYDLFSPVYLATSPFSTFDTNLIPTAFSVGIDDNVAAGQGSEQLVFFRTLICSGATINTCTTIDTANSYQPGSPTDISVVNGNGFSDLGLSGFQLTAGVHYAFEASVRNDTDGMEELFLITNTSQRIPEPASLAIFGAALAGLGLLRRRHRKAM